MKRILTIVFALMLILTLTFCTFAEEVATDTGLVEDTQTDTDKGETPTDQTAGEIVKETTDRISTILGIGGAVGIGAIIIAILGFVASNFKKILTVVNSIGSVFKTIFTKDGNVENVPQAFGEIKQDVKELAKNFNQNLEIVQEELKQEKEKNEKIVQLFSVFIINCTYINPYAKNEIIKLISGTKEFGENAYETIQNITKAVEQAKATEEKIPTPYLDKVTGAEGEA